MKKLFSFFPALVLATTIFAQNSAKMYADIYQNIGRRHQRFG